jgi:hypothetical protein
MSAILTMEGLWARFVTPCPPPFGSAELFKIDPVNFVVTFFSRPPWMVEDLEMQDA